MTTINTAECVGCGACVDACPEHAITCDEVAVIDVSKCDGCGNCISECPSGCISA